MLNCEPEGVCSQEEVLADGGMRFLVVLLLAGAGEKRGL